ncbi:MAG: hypothetical protein GC191_20140 [Azospirillum sp.]|nr:hypothetical protein [Azospirillum sp.]
MSVFRKFSPAARRALAHFGHVNPISLVLALITLLMFDISGNAVFSIIDAWIKGEPANTLIRLIPVAIFLALVGVLYCLGRQFAARTPTIEVDPAPPKARALVILLSSPVQHPKPPPAPADIRARLAEIGGSMERNTLVPAAVEAVVRSWRMPIESILYHYGALERVILVTSSGADGSQTYVASLIELIERLDQAPGGRRMQVQTADQFLERLETGIDFVDAEQIFETVRQVTTKLLSLLKKGRHIAIDVTGGQKITSIMVAAVSLAEESLSFQYVDFPQLGGPARVCNFDVTYRLDEAN